MKRFLALTVALALMLSLAPSVFAEDAGWEWAREAKSFVYEFNSYAHAGTNTTAGTKNYVHSVEQTIATASEGYCKWGFVNMRNDTAFPYTDTTHMVLNPRMNGNGPVYDPDVTSNAGYEFSTVWRSAYAFELDIEESGTYLPTIDYTTDTQSPIVDIYLIEKPANGDEALNWHTNGKDTSIIQTYAWTLPSTARIGKSIDMKNATTLNKSAELMPVELDASKNYYLFIIPVGITDNPSTTNDIYSGSKIFLRSLTLSQRLPEDAQALNYIVKKTSLSSKLPTSSDTQQGIYTNGYVYNLSYFDWETTSQLVADATAEKGVSVDETIEPYKTLDLTKTAPFKIEKGAKGFNNPMVQNPYIVTGLYTSYYGKTPIGERAHLALRLNVPYAGRYKLEIVKNGGTTLENSAFMKVYFGKAADTYNATDIQSKIDSGDYAHLGWYNFYEGMYTKETTPENKVSSDYYTVDIPTAGEYHLVLDACSESLTFNSYSGTQFFRLGQVNLTPVPGVLSEAEVKVQTIANTMTADIAVESADAAPTAATVNVLTRDIEGNADASAVVTTISGNVGSNLTATAPEKDGYEFLYWEKGIGNNRRVVSYEPEYSFKAVSGGAWLTAVYRNTSSEALPVTFYNAIGDELSTAIYSEGDTITVPSVPAFENYAFIGWKCAETGDVYENGDAIIAEGKQMRIVAQYEDSQTANIAVSVTGGTGAGTYTYGDKVRVSATEREGGNGSKVFVYWTKNGEIVSFNKTYEFLAAENCSLTAVYEDYKPTIAQELRRIIISGNFAEFIGLDDASEKGVLFNENGGDVSFATATHKIAMTGEGNQLKFENDLGASSTMTGYAIVDGKVIYSK